MLRALSRGLLLAAFLLSMLSVANAGAIVPLTIHRDDVDVSRYPWSAVGKLYNETGASCSGVLISRDKILTAAHCIYNHRTGRFIAPEALHFLVGYRTGRYSAHARVVRYEIGAGFDPLRYEATSDADWAVLTMTESLPANIEPLRLRRDPAPSGTKAVLVGYPQDRAFAMTADRDCELREKIDAGRLFLHTCRGIKGYSGAPILVSDSSGQMQIAGIQIAMFNSDGTQKMIAVPAQAIWRQSEGEGHAVVQAAVAGETCHSADGTEMRLTDVQAKLGLDMPELVQTNADPADIVSSIPEPPASTAAGWIALVIAGMSVP